MIQKYVDRFIAKRESLGRELLGKKCFECYADLVKFVVTAISEDKYDDLDPSRIHEIDDGKYQGTLVYVIAEKGYQPNDYWAVKIRYGSCSVCDTLQGIMRHPDEGMNESQVKATMSLCLHIVQSLRSLGEEAYAQSLSSSKAVWQTSGECVMSFIELAYALMRDFSLIEDDHGRLCCAYCGVVDQDEKHDADCPWLLFVKDLRKMEGGVS